MHIESQNSSGLGHPGPLLCYLHKRTLKPEWETAEEMDVQPDHDKAIRYDVNMSASDKSDANSTELWDAPMAAKPLHATVTIPGSKSLSNRYLILAALGNETVTLHGVLRSRDTALMMDALRELGVSFTFPDAEDNTIVEITPPVQGQFHGNTSVFCGLAGTVMRFLPGLAVFADGPVHFDGDKQAYARPMKPVLDGLEQLGAIIEYEGEEGYLPFTVTPPSRAIRGKQMADVGYAEVAIDSSSSSQFISGLLLMASRLPHGLRLTHTGEHVPSMPHIQMTISDVNGAGGSIHMDGAKTWVVEPKPLQLPKTITIEPDLSNAAPFLGAAMIAGGSVSIPRWPVHTTQPGGLLPGILQAMGARVDLDGKPLQSDGSFAAEVVSTEHGGTEVHNGTLTVTGTGTIHGLANYDMAAAGEIAPSIAALAVLAQEPTSLRGIGHLRGHETNRLEALVQEIQRIGGRATELEDGIAIEPVNRDDLHGEVMESYADHRMATFAAMLGLVIPDTRVVNIMTTRKTIPDFPGMWRSMLDQQ